MSAQMFPASWNEIRAHRQEGWEAEERLLEFLVKSLPSEYCVYFRPRVNGMKPDIVVTNKDWGVVVFEVKDWNLANFHRKDGMLYGVFDGRECAVKDPIHQAKRFANRIFEQFLGVEEHTRKLGEESNDFRICLHAIYMHGQPASEVERLFGAYSFGQGRTNIVLHDDILSLAVPWTQYTGMRRSKYITPSQSKAICDLHRWLQPPPDTHPQDIDLSEKQRELSVSSRGHYRIRGSPGSGKSVVLAIRAAQASHEGSVALVCFNITMAHHLRDMVSKYGDHPCWQNLTIRHFHGLMHDMTAESDLSVLGDDESVADHVVKALLSGSCNPPDKFRGLFIDEAQDFEPEWVDALARLLTDKGELVIAADYRQHIYSQAGAGDMRRHQVARFGEWQVLNKTFRLYWRVAWLLNEVQERAKLGDEYDASLNDYHRIKGEDDLFRELRWENCETWPEVTEKLLGHLGHLPHPESVAILVRNHVTGLQVVRFIEDQDARYKPVSHVFSEDGPNSIESKRRKHSFWMGGGALKVCTLHSFKGWEIPNVIVLWTGDEADRRDFAELYVAVSRAVAGPDVESSLLVLNLNREFDALAGLDAFQA